MTRLAARVQCGRVLTFTGYGLATALLAVSASMAYDAASWWAAPLYGAMAMAFSRALDSVWDFIRGIRSGGADR